MGSETRRYLALFALCLAVPLLIPLGFYLAGAIPAAIALGLVLAEPDPTWRRRMLVLLGLLVLLTVAPIDTDTGTPHFVTLSLFFATALVGPYLLLRRTDPGVIDYRVFPQTFRWRDVIYVAISIPLAWGVIEFYFFRINPSMPTQWPLPAEPDREAVWRLVAGINLVGIWDELFFINTVYAILRSIFPARVANLSQGVFYASVLNDMAFVGIGPIVVFLFALTQGKMYEGSRSLVWVLLVHIIVDIFLVSAILRYYYPGHSLNAL